MSRQALEHSGVLHLSIHQTPQLQARPWAPSQSLLCLLDKGGVYFSEGLIQFGSLLHMKGVLVFLQLIVPGCHFFVAWSCICTRRLPSCQRTKISCTPIMVVLHSLLTFCQPLVNLVLVWYLISNSDGKVRLALCAGRVIQLVTEAFESTGVDLRQSNDMCGSRPDFLALSKVCLTV